uniref:Death domain-containing protein n=1 Tax=Amphimedon queenslandica TaxID=400682 RepID=A0A1X7SNJ1_AMPQE
MAERRSASSSIKSSPLSLKVYSVMNGKPDLKTVCAIVRTSRWHQLGLQLGVDEAMLQDIETEKSETQDKRTQMFRLWIASQPGASHNQLVEAMRLKVIGEDRMAQEYEERVKEEASKTHHTGVQVVQASVSTAPAWSTSTVINSITQKVSEVDLLTDQAYKLQDKYHKLLLEIQELSQNANVGIVKNLLRNILQENCIYQLHGLSFYKQQIDGITSMNEVFAFLIENHFVGYLNYYLLMKFSRKVVCGDRYKEAKQKVLKYEKHYRKFIDEPAFYQLIMFFDENPHLNPGTVVGLPIVIVSLSQKWKTRNKKDLNEWIPFLKENKHLLQ